MFCWKHFPLVGAESTRKAIPIHLEDSGKSLHNSDSAASRKIFIFLLPHGVKQSQQTVHDATWPFDLYLVALWGTGQPACPPAPVSQQQTNPCSSQPKLPPGLLWPLFKVTSNPVASFPLQRTWLPFSLCSPCLFPAAKSRSSSASLSTLQVSYTHNGVCFTCWGLLQPW